jgi:putative phosphoribosyl transferase
MTIEAIRGANGQARLADRAQAGDLLRPLLRRACRGVPVVVGIGAGGLAVAASARGPASPLGALAVEEFDLPGPLHPGTASGAVSTGGRTLLRPPAYQRLLADTARLRSSIRAARAGLGASPPPGGYTGPDVAGRDVVLVDDGTSPVSRLAAALDFLRRGRPQSVTLAVACAPRELIDEMERFAGDVVVAVVPTWSGWFHLHGRLYESDLHPSVPEVTGLLSRLSGSEKP